MKIQLYTDGLNMGPDRAHNASPTLSRLLIQTEVDMEIHYFDGDIVAWFGTEEKVKQHSKDGLIVIHVDGFTKADDQTIWDLCERFGMLAIADPDQIITNEGRKDASDFADHIYRLLCISMV